MAHNHIRCKAEGPELCQQASPGSRLSELIMVKTGYTSAPLLVIVDVNIIKHCRKYFKPKFYKISIEVNVFSRRRSSSVTLVWTSAKTTKHLQLEIQIEIRQYMWAEIGWIISRKLNKIIVNDSPGRMKAHVRRTIRNASGDRELSRGVLRTARLKSGSAIQFCQPDDENLALPPSLAKRWRLIRWWTSVRGHQLRSASQGLLSRTRHSVVITV